MGLKLVFETEDESSEEIECPQCGEECEADDNFCCECGAKLSKAPVGKASARLSAMKNMTEPSGQEND